MTFIENRVQPQALTVSRSPRALLSFVAYGREFDVDLSPNDRLTSTLDAPTLAKLDRLDVYEGELRNAPHSWVRLTRYLGEWSGVVYDGAELYAIEPYANVASSLVQPNAPGDAPVIYRWKDTTGALVDEIGPVIAEPVNAISPAVAPSPLPLLSPGKQIDVGLIAGAPNPGYPVTEALLVAMANVADGIFVSQVGVRLNVAQIEMLTSATDPFDAADPATLLSELASHKAASRALKGLGLAHLFTTRTFSDPSVVGIAYQSSLCEAGRSVGLTKLAPGVAVALIATHEMGHNFGAPHDGVQGPCESTPQTYLMSPTLNGSQEFSACSLEQISEFIPKATCLYPPPMSDLSFRNVPAPAHLSIGFPFTIVAVVDNHGGDALAVSASAVGDGITIDRVTYSSCDLSISPGCRVPHLSDGQSMGVTVYAKANRAGADAIDFSVRSINESNPLDNDYRLNIDVGPAVNLAVDTLAATPKALHPFESAVFTLDFSNRGSVTATQVIARLTFDVRLAVLDVASPAGVCGQVEPTIWTCPIGSMAPGASMRITAKTRDTAGTEGPASVWAAVDSAEPDFGAAAANLLINVGAVIADLSISATSTAMQSRIAGGSAVQITLQAHNAGPDRADDVRLGLLPYGDLLSLQAIDGHGGRCPPPPYTSSVWGNCTFGTVPSGGNVSVTYSGTLGHSTEAFRLVASVGAAAVDADTTNNSTEMILNVFESPAPSAPPSQPTSPPATSGSGGGAVDWLSATLLAAALVSMWRKTTRSRRLPGRERCGSRWR